MVSPESKCHPFGPLDQHDFNPSSAGKLAMFDGTNFAK